MFQLNVHNEEVHKKYINKVLPSLIKRIKKGRRHQKTHIELSDSVKDILLSDWNAKNPQDTKLLERLLIGEPQILADLNDDINARIEQLPVKDRSDNKTIELIFHYDGVFNQNPKELSYWLAKKIGRNTCTYCNRQYVFTIETINNNGEVLQIARPEFDHWFAKSDYPLLSLSLYNLIPSCKVCNSSVKGGAKMSLTSHVHPYVKENALSQFSFRAIPKISKGLVWGIKIDRIPGSKVDNTIREFAIEEIYSMHEPLEVKDIMDFYDSYPNGYVNSLISKLCDDSNHVFNRSDAYRILFGAESSPEKYLDRPFSKLKHDLLRQIGIDLEPIVEQYY